MKTLYCPKYPNLRTHNPTAWFVGGVAEVSDEDAEVLLARTALGITEAAPAAPREVAEDVGETAENASETVDDAAPVKLPGKNATVADWIAFMAKHGIKHAEDATKAEMKAAAEAHFTAPPESGSAGDEKADA